MTPIDTTPTLQYRPSWLLTFITFDLMRFDGLVRSFVSLKVSFFQFQSLTTTFYYCECSKRKPRGLMNLLDRVVVINGGQSTLIPISSGPLRSLVDDAYQRHLIIVNDSTTMFWVD